MGWIAWGWAGVLLVCFAAGWLIYLGPVRHFAEDVGAEAARELFRKRREWLEADFLNALGKTCPTERLRWEEAHWHDEIIWARDRKTRRLQALIGVHFDSSLYDELSDPGTAHATALFEFRKGSWHAEGKRLDEISPDEVVRRYQRFEPIVMNPRRGF
jgi:hypothetical protein